jgi:aminopeptidase N
MTTFYSQKFGEYPFEKGGFAYVPSSAGFPWAGMENQTLITMYAWQEQLAAHEYSHMWFGDLITCGTWPDVWLNEGFATWVEALWLEHKTGYASYKSRIVNYANQYFSGNPGWALNNPPMNDLYNYAMVYCKGACVLHMLRYVLGDTVFFNCMKSYATDTLYKYKSAVTDDFTAKISSVAGQNLSWFIDEWVKQPNHPVYQNTYSIIYISPGNYQLKFFAKQTQTNSAFHKMPIVLKVSFTSGNDSLLNIMNDANNQEFNFYFNRQPTTLLFDPNNDIVIKSATTSIGIKEITNEIPTEYKLFQNFPNPFNPSTKIKFSIPQHTPYPLSRGENVSLKIYDITGKEIATLVNEALQPGMYEVTFDGTNLPSGIYFYRFSAGDFSDVKKLILLK